MRLRSIEVEGWQCLVEPCAVGEFAPGLNVVHAPNGTGKSTLFNALRRALFDKHGAGGERIEQLRPWGRDVAPRVTVTFDHVGVGYRIEKRFLDAPRATLSRREDGRFVPLAEAEKADAWLHAMLRATPPGRGGSSGPDHWGVAATCWVPQGELELSALAPSLAALVQSSLSVQAVGVGGDAIERAVEARVAEMYTATGKLKAGQNEPVVVTLRKRLVDLNARRDALVPQVEQFEEASRRVEALQSERRQARLNEAEQAATLARLRAAAAGRQAIEAQLRDLALAEERTRAEYDRARGRIDAIAAARAAVVAAKAEQTQLADADPSIAAERTAAQRALDAANARLATIRVAREAIAVAELEADAADAFTRVAADIAAFSERAARLRSIDAELAALRRQSDALRSPSASALKQIRAADAARATARAALDASLITLRIEPLADITIEARLAERPGVHKVAAGEAMTVRGTPEVVVEIGGFVLIRASGPTVGSIDDVRAAIADAEARVAKLAAALGTGNVDELQRRADIDAELRVQIASVEANRAAIVGDAAGDLEQALARATATRSAIIAARPAWGDAPPDARGLREATCARKRQHERDADDAARDRERATDAWQRADSAAARHAERLVAARRRVADAAASLDRLLAADALDDAARAARLDDAAIAWHAAGVGLKRARDALDVFGEDAAAALARAERKQLELAKSMSDLSESEHRAAGHLAAIGESGAYSQLALVDEQIAQAEVEFAAADAAARAVRLLGDTVRGERERLVRSVAGPVEAIAADVLRRVAGARLADVRVDERFAPASIAAAGSSIDLSTLSGGEREQVHLAVRLALADALGPNGIGLVVLDDVLIATDAGRFGRMQAVLEDFAQRMQILIFTCHPERYRGLDGATFFDLEAIRATHDRSR